MSMLQSPSRYKNCQQEEKTMDLLHHLDRYCNSKYAQVIEQRIQKAERRIESLLSPTNYACTFCTRFLRKEPFLLFLRELRHFYCNALQCLLLCGPSAGIKYFIVLGWLEQFEYLNYCHFPAWGYLNIFISPTALAASIQIFNSVSLAGSI